jgi:hypothetical protein
MLIFAYRLAVHFLECDGKGTAIKQDYEKNNSVIPERPEMTENDRK